MEDTKDDESALPRLTAADVHQELAKHIGRMHKVAHFTDAEVLGAAEILALQARSALTSIFIRAADRRQNQD